MRHRLSFFIHVHRSGRASVVARLTSPAFRKVDCSVGPLVGDWDRDRQRAKAASREAANLNLRLAEIERGVEAFFTRADLDGRQPAREEAARALRELCGGAETSTRVTLQEALKRRLKAASNEWSGGTYGKYRALARHLADHSPAATCDEVDDGWVDDFAAHLIRGGVTNTTAIKYCKSLLALLRWAASEGPHNRRRASILRILRDKSAILPIKKGPVRGALLVSGWWLRRDRGGVQDYAKIREIYAKFMQKKITTLPSTTCRCSIASWPTR